VKRIVGVLLIMLMLCITLIQPVWAADALHRMLHGEQDAIILGQIENRQDDLLELRVIRLLQGKDTGNKIQVKDDFTYFGFTEENGSPSLGDYVVMSLNEKEGHYEQAWYMVRSDHGHMRSLALYYEPAAGPAPSDLKALQYFVNTGGKATDYYFEGNQVFAQRNLLEDVDLTDSLTAWVGKEEAAELAAQTVEEDEDEEGLTLGVILSGFMIVFFTLVIFIRIRAVFLTQRQQQRQQQRQKQQQE